VVDVSVVMKQIGVKIEYFRKIKGLSRSELAEAINMSVNSIGRIERGNYNKSISVHTIIAIAEGLDIEFTKLLEFSDQEKARWEVSDFKNFIK